MRDLHQPYSEIKKMSMREILIFSELLKEEDRDRERDMKKLNKR